MVPYIPRPAEYDALSDLLSAGEIKWIAGGFRYESLPVELDEDIDQSRLAGLSSPLLLEEVDFSRGRVKPRFLWDISSGLHLRKREQKRVSLQVDLINVTNRFYLINFNGLFSGTGVGLPRTVCVKLSVQL